MADRNLVLQLLISAKDEATSVFGKLFGYLDNNTRVVANKIREAFSGLFGGGADEAIAFEAQLDRVASKGGYTADAMGELAGQARAVGAEFGVSGTQAADALETLAAAGLTAQEAIGALPSVLALAKSEQISTAAAAEKLVDSLSIMGLGFEDTARMADVLAKGADITTSSASQLAEALSEAGGTARAAGLDLESTVAALDLLHKNGIKGSEAGTALKSILTSLLDPASKASQELNQLGITSRDLGTVIGQLKDKGTAANAAILAFGTEAGPGLRALLAEGQTGLNDYTAQLSNAEGAAQAAADAMGGNLQSALNSLNSVWASLKATLIEPLLEPIAQQARALAAAFQGALSDGSIKGVQDLLKEFGTGIADGIARAIASFDFAAAATRIEQFATAAKGHFETVQAVAVAAGGAIQTVFNAVTGAINLVLASVAQTASNAFSLLSTIERQAARIGLGTLERADELLRKAQAASDTAADLARAAEQDARDLADGANQAATAFDNLSTRIDAARVAADAVQPPDFGSAATLEPITRSLADLEGQFKRAQAAQEQAAQAARASAADYARVRAEFDAGRASLYAYDEAKRQDVIAQDALRRATESAADSERAYAVAVQDSIRAINTESAAATAGVQTKQQLIDEQRKLTTDAQAYTDKVGEVVAAQAAGLRAELALAQAKGQTATAQRLAMELAQAELDGAIRVAQAKQAQAQAELALSQLLLQQAERRAANNEITQEALALAQLEVEKNIALANAAGVQTEALIAQGQALQNLQQQQQGGTEVIQQHTGATRDNAQALQQQADAAEQSGGMALILANALQGAREATNALSEATGALFEKLYTAARVQQNFSVAQQAYLGQLNQGAEQYADLNQKIAENIAQIKSADAAYLISADNLGRWLATLNKAKAQASLAFYEQKLAAAQLQDAMEALAAKGASGLGSLAAAMTRVQRETALADQQFGLLNEQDLNQLKAAIAAATQKLQDMQQATLDARDRLAELNAELLEAKGADEKAARLRLELETQQRLKEIEAQRAEAERTHNTELLQLLEQQRLKILEIAAAKEKSLADEARAQAAERAKTATPAATTATRSTASGGASTGGASTGGTTNTFNIHVDGKDLLSEDAVRNKVIPILQRATRLSA